MTDSSTGGYLTPDPAGPPAPLEDAALDAFLQALLVGVTGMDPTTVRPRWQPEAPNLPAGDWAAFGATMRRSDVFPFEEHDGSLSAGAGADLLTVNEEMDLVASFYGPNCGRNASTARDGFQIAQNREAIELGGFKIAYVGDLTRAPVLFKNLWTGRTDLTVVVRRQFTRQYPVLNILSAQAEIIAGPADVLINANP